LPAEGKLCNFDCIYCECGWNKDGRDNKKIPTFADVHAAMSRRFSELSAEGKRIDSITFSGNGEPTVHPDFPAVVDMVLELRDRYYPDAKVSVLSNATMLGRSQVREALKKIDNPILKVDASDDRLISLINKPVGLYKLADVVEWLKDFDGDFVLQTMFLRSPEFDLSAPEQLQGWMDIVRQTRPREVMVYTIDRETPDKSLGKYTIEEMNDMTAPLLEEGFKIQIRG
jgi:wyosine [tRNA(Phe)-imidazoG37] synthetase (radical SAM superfamily)